MTTGKTKLFIVIAVLTIIPFLQAQQPQSAPTPPVPQSPSKAADSSKPGGFYLLYFSIREMEGEKSLNTSNYSLLVQAGHPAKMTSGSQVPYQSGSGNTAYRSIGISMSGILQETDGSPWLSLNLDISGLAPPEKVEDKYSPIFRSTNISADAMLTLGKATMVGSVDDPATKHRLQVEVTATKLK